MNTMGMYSFTGSAQIVTVTETGTYDIEAFGAQGGVSSGKGGVVFAGGEGAEVGGNVQLTAGEKLEIIVGGQGGGSSSGNVDGAGGGGGTFVLGNTGTGYAPLVVAGGGGGAGYFGPGGGGTLAKGNGQGGAGGSGANNYGNNGGGGAGVKSDGGNGSDFASGHGGLNGTGNYAGGGGGGYAGGFGGGGGGGFNGGGGGGGYSGGAGAQTFNGTVEGLGGYSLDTGTPIATQTSAAKNIGAGEVILVPPPTVTITGGGPIGQGSEAITGTVNTTADPQAVGTTVTVQEGSTSVGTGTVASNGSWSAPVTLSLGDHLLTASDTDTNGLKGTSSGVLFTVFTTVSSGAETITNLSGSATFSIGATTLTVNEGSAGTFSGTIQDGVYGIGGNLVVSGSAPLILTGVETYTGRTSVSGTLALAGTGSVHSSTKVALTASGAAFDISGATAGEVVNKLGGVAGTVAALGSQNLKIKVQNGTVDTFSGTIQDGGISSGTGGSITLGGTGELNLTAAESYTGATTLDAGTLALTGSGSIATSSGLSLLSSLGANSTFDISGEAAASIGTLSGVAGTTIALGAGTLTVTEASAGSFAGVIADGGLSSGTGGSLVVGGTTALTLTGVETYTGRTSVSGTLDLSGSGSIHSSTKVALTKAGAMLDISGATGGEVVNKLGGVAGTATALGSQNLKIKVQAGTVDQYSGTIEDGGIAGGTGGSVTLGGQGTLVLGAGSSYTGGTTLDAGTLELATFDAAGSGTITFANPASNGVATLQIDAAALSSAGPTASAFADAIAGATSANQVIDLRSLAYNQGSTSATVTGGTSLVVSDGPSTVTLTLASSTSKSSFVTASDGHGGTLVYDPPATKHAPATAKIDTHWIEAAMADFGGVSGDGHAHTATHDLYGIGALAPAEHRHGHLTNALRA